MFSVCVCRCKFNLVSSSQTEYLHSTVQLDDHLDRLSTRMAEGIHSAFDSQSVHTRGSLSWFTDSADKRGLAIRTLGLALSTPAIKRRYAASARRLALCLRGVLREQRTGCTCGLPSQPFQAIWLRLTDLQEKWQVRSRWAAIRVLPTLT